MSSTRRHVTILIIGSGIAGCTAALTLADAGRDVLLINAGPDLDDGNTPLAQGGIIYKAADTPRDAEARALEHDILVAGHRYNNNRAVRFLCRQGPDCVDNMLIERAGVDFDRNEDGTYNVTYVVLDRDGNELFTCRDYYLTQFGDRVIFADDTSYRVTDLAGHDILRLSRWELLDFPADD